MRRPTRNRRKSAPLTAALTVLSAAGIIATTAFAPASVTHSAHTGDSASASRANPSHSGCVYVGGDGSGVTERTTRFDYIGSTPVPTPVQKVGDTVTYYDEIYDAHDNVIGHTIGYVTAIYQSSPGHLMTQYSETVELPGGRLTATGFMERQSMVTGGTVHLRAVGVSGTFAGKHGYRDWALKKPIPDPLTSAERVTMSVKLCG